MLSDTPHPSQWACSLFVTSRPLPSPASPLLSPSPQKLPETGREVRCQASRNPCLIILLGKVVGEQRKGAFSYFGRLFHYLPLQWGAAPWAVGSPEL